MRWRGLERDTAGGRIRGGVQGLDVFVLRARMCGALIREACSTVQPGRPHRDVYRSEQIIETAVA